MSDTHTTTRWIDTADVAKMIRKHLKSVFPGVKFSVKIQRYSGGSSVRINWVDGPTDREVSSIVGQYRGSDFDGMTDSTVTREPTIIATEQGIEAVRFSPGFIFTNRRYSAETLRNAVAEVAKKYGCSGDAEIREGYFGAEFVNRKDAERAVCENAEGEIYWSLEAVARRHLEGND